MKTVRAESTRRGLARPAARAVVIPPSGKRGNARRAALAVDTGSVPCANLAAPAEDIASRTTSTRRSNGLRLLSEGAPASASTCVSSANSPLSGFSKIRCSARSGSAGMASSTATGFQWRSGMPSSRGRVEIATSAMKRYLQFRTSTMTTRAAPGSDLAASVYEGSPVRNVIRESASSAMTRSACGGRLTTLKQPTGSCAAGRCHRHQHSLNAKIKSRPD